MESWLAEFLRRSTSRIRNDWITIKWRSFIGSFSTNRAQGFHVRVMHLFKSRWRHKFKFPLNKTDCSGRCVIIIVIISINNVGNASGWATVYTRCAFLFNYSGWITAVNHNQVGWKMWKRPVWKMAYALKHQAK